LLNKFPAPGSRKFFDLTPIRYPLLKALAKAISFHKTVSFLSALMCVFLISPTSFADIKFINTTYPDTTIALRGDDELILPFSTDQENFVIVLLKEHNISARLYLETDTGKILQESRIRDLYLRRSRMDRTT
jgi:hypothetical protein